MPPVEVDAVALLAPDILATEHGVDWRLVAVALKPDGWSNCATVG